MLCDFDRIFHPTPIERAEDLEFIYRILEEIAKAKGCGTCKHCEKVVSYPGFVTGEECVCNAGLECDTVFFSVTNCDKYQEMDFIGLIPDDFIVSDDPPLFLKKKLNL